MLSCSLRVMRSEFAGEVVSCLKKAGNELNPYEEKK